MNSIVLSNITYRYPLTDFDALHNVNFCFEEGKFYGVIGPNGAGKTTLCSLVKGLIPGFFQGELTGEVQILGKRMEDWDESELTSRVGYIFQNPFTQISGVKDTVFEEIAIGLENLRMPKEEIISRVVDIVRLIGIEDLIELNPNELSGGQRQRVAFASILAMNCDIYVIDEPTASCIYTQKGNKKIRKPQAANQTALIFDRRAAARLLSINSIRRLCWS